MKKRINFKYLVLFLSLVLMLFYACKQNPEVEENTKKKKKHKNNITEEVPKDVQLSSIKIALVDSSNQVGEFKDVQNFNAEKRGPYEATEDAETAYISLKVELKAENSGDITISATNTNAFEGAVSLQKGSGNDFTTERKIILSKGINTLDVKVLSRTTEIEDIYKVNILYAGGPSEPGSYSPENAPIPGIYCPTQRKEAPGETKELIWIICIGGNCPNCTSPLMEAGKTGKLASDYLDRGLRVVAMQHRTRQFNPAAALEKWRTSRLRFNMYTAENNCLYEYCKNDTGVPKFHWIKDGIQISNRRYGNTEKELVEQFLAGTIKPNDE